MFRPIAVAVAILASSTTFAAAAETPEQRQACYEDANAYCPDDIPDRELVYACLVRNVNRLSPACKNIIRESIPPRQRRR